VRMQRFLGGLTAAALLWSASPLLAQPIRLAPVVSGLASPVFVTNAGDGLGRLFMVEQAGIVKVLAPGGWTPSVFLDIRSKVLFGGERGMLGLAFHPLYASNGRLFVFYTRLGDGALVVSEYRAAPANANTAGATETILLTIPHPTNSNHNGGMLAFGPDGYLYVGVGDGGGSNDVPNNAQNTNTLLGKILRLDVNGGAPYTTPPNNPFAGAAPGLDEIFAYGLRNPWRFSFDRDTGQAWIGDVGQGAREEVDAPLVNGGNYGWRVFEGTQCTNTDPTLCANPANYVMPVFDYGHSGGRCSLTGGYVYRGTLGALSPGTYIYGDYCSGEIFGWNGSTQSVLLDTTLKVSSFGEDEQGELYVVGLGGTVSRIVRAAPCTFAITPTRATFGAGASAGTVTVTAGAGCAWTARRWAAWITITAGGSGSGNGTVTYAIAPYTGKLKNRSGAITVAGQTLIVKQSR
jgi:glucose/arabinose dehydrogenase